MRDIIYRGKTKDGEWEYGGVVIHEKDAFVITKEDFEWSIMGDRGDYDGCITPVLPETVGQYTGLTDKNGKKIFEGDIVKFGKYIYQIVFSVGSFSLYDEQGLIIAKIGGINDHCYSLMNLYVECCWEDNWAYDIEILGNIHDNPEPLEVK